MYLPVSWAGGILGHTIDQLGFHLPNLSAAEQDALDAARVTLDAG